MKKVAIALSGGVDSSVCALLLKERGYEVVGITLKLSSVDSCDSNIQVCCSTKDIIDAKKVANFLGIPHFVIDWQEIFQKRVVDYFVDRYMQGETPNPCAICNRDVKTGLLASYTKRVLKADFLATGHYIKKAFMDNQHVLLRGKDETKDQSYFLSLLPKEVVDMLIFPIGEFTKKEVREIARQNKLPISEKKESFEICFTAGKEPYTYLLERGISMKEGDIVHISGKVLGKHKGLAAYTIGQRRGLSVAWKKALYVIDKDPQENMLIVGEKEYLFTDCVEADYLNIMVDLKYWSNISIQGRYRQKAIPVERFQIDGEKLKVYLSKPQPKFAPGQVLAIYKDNILLGGAIITKS